MTVGLAKESVVEIFGGLGCTQRNKDFVYFICYLLLVVRALIGPIMEFVHVFVDTKNYLKLINCEGKLLTYYFPIRNTHVD